MAMDEYYSEVKHRTCTVQSFEIKVTIKDVKGNTFSKGWKDTPDKRDAIRWTLESGDVPYYLDVAAIVEIKVTKGDD